MIVVTALFLVSMLLLTNLSEAQFPRAPPGRYPYFTFLEITRERGGGRSNFRCGGTLALQRDIVLTAAHCLDEQEAEFGTIVGIRAIIDPSQQHIVRMAAAHTLHANYVPIGQRNFAESDLALIRLSEPVNTIEPVQINSDMNLPIDGQSVRFTVFGGLAVATVQIVNHNECREAGSRHDLINNFVHLCAAGSSPAGTDPNSCHGDNGGPLIIPSTNEDPSGDIQVGITNLRGGCTNPDFPGVYTRISSFSQDLVTRSCFFSHTSACSDFFFGMMSQSRSGRMMKKGGSMGMKVSMGSMMMGIARVSVRTKGVMRRPRKSGMMAMKVSIGSMMMGIARVSVRTNGVMRRPRKSGMMAMGMGQSSSGMKGMRF